MKVINYAVPLEGRNASVRLYALGDVHLGAANCAERELIRLIDLIAADENAYWIGGGDCTDAIILNDTKRFDVNTLPNWMLVGNPRTIKSRIGDILFAQRERFVDLTRKIHSKCIGMIEGNHEYSIFKYHNHDHMSMLCDQIGADNLTDCAFIRMQFRRKSKTEDATLSTRSVTIFICHGHGGGRTAGAEPNKLARLASDKDVDILLTGHSHTFNILPPIPTLYIPMRGVVPTDPCVREKHVGNWGAFLYCYKEGPSTYDSRANYPVRPMYTIQTEIQPFAKRANAAGEVIEQVRINMNAIKL